VHRGHCLLLYLLDSYGNHLIGSELSINLATLSEHYDLDFRSVHAGSRQSLGEGEVERNLRRIVMLSLTTGAEVTHRVTLVRYASLSRFTIIQSLKSDAGITSCRGTRNVGVLTGSPTDVLWMIS
jgi:hypothetical protein